MTMTLRCKLMHLESLSVNYKKMGPAPEMRQICFLQPDSVGGSCVAGKLTCRAPGGQLVTDCQQGYLAKLS